MFKGRRNRAATGPSPLGARTPPVNTVAAANTAALQAFMASQNATKLSAAAAATAVRSHTPPATNVAEVQTKRTMRRSSIGSNSSAPARTGTPQRRLSSGSMTERTFREPSPGRAGSNTTDEKPPPLPKVPKATSPLPKKKSKATPPQPKLEISPADSPSSPTPGGRSSVNFSRPMSPTSPPASPTTNKRPKPPATAGAAPSSGPIMTPNEAEQISHSVVEAGTQPVKKKKKAIAPQVSEGSHLQAGTTAGGKPRGTALGAAAAAAALSAKGASSAKASSPPPAKKKQPLTSAATDEPSNKATAVKASAADAPETSRASGALAKQPSIVREDREAEELAEKGIDSSTVPSTEDKPPPPRKNKAKAKATAPGDPEKLELDTRTGPKRESVSPGRAARFSGVVLEPPGHHNPLGRSASPSKSAMKQSPSPRNASPSDPRGQAWNRPGFTPSEASDTPSATSEDIRRRKRFSRVSFDVEPTIVGEAAETPAIDSPVIASPQNEKPSKRNWFSFGRDKGKPAAGAEGDEVMKPVPTLPSFGSVRGKRDSLIEDEREPSPARALPRATSARAKHVTKAPSPDPPQPATDEALEANKPTEQDDTRSTVAKPALDPNEPLPPEVTSVEGSGQYDYSDLEDDTSDVGKDVAPPQTAASEVPMIAEPKETELSALAESESKHTSITAPPAIELQPATPAVDDADKMRDSYVQVPGGWGKDSESSTTANGSVPEESRVASALPTAEEKGKPTDDSESDAVRTETPIVRRKSTGNESDSSTPSVYSDAEEYDGDGFGSINAIVDSPMPKAKDTTAKAPESPIAEKETNNTAANSQKPVKAPLKSALKKDREETAAVAVPAIASAGTKSSQKQSTMRKSMRDASPVTSTSPNRMRASMRTPDTREGPMRMMSTPTPVKTTPAPAKTTPLSTKTTPASAKTTPTPPKAAIPEARTRGREPTRAAASPTPQASGGRLQKKQRPLSHLQAAITPLPVATQARPRPVSMGADGRIPKTDIPAIPIPSSKKFAGYDSDSDSSFKRARRPARASSESRVTMRRSMRANPPQQTRKDPRSTGFHSPKSSTSTTRPTSMRMTMRGAPTPPPPERQRSRTPTRGLFSRTSKAPPLPVEPAPSVTKRFKSRFADSDSDDDVLPARAFRSRFADSSDEDEPAELDSTSVTQTPARASKSFEPAKLPAEAPERTFSFTKETPLSTKTLRSADKENVPDKEPESPKSPISSFSLRRDPEKRRSILSTFSLGRRKDRGSKVAKVDIESAARRDTPLERSRNERQNIPEIATPSTSTVDQVEGTPTPASKVPLASNAPTPARPTSPPRSVSKLLQRRQTSDGWTSPPPEPPSSDRPPPPTRPMTSDGTSRAKKTSLGSRALGGSRPTTPPSFPKTMRGPKAEDQKDAEEKEVVPETPLSVSASQRGQKRKRFQGLRKAFGIKD